MLGRIGSIIYNVGVDVFCLGLFGVLIAIPALLFLYFTPIMMSFLLVVAGSLLLLVGRLLINLVEREG